MYCKEEGLEGLQQCYINVHGLCRLPRAHVQGSNSKGGKCSDCGYPWHAEYPEDASLSIKDDGKCNSCNRSRYAEGLEEAPSTKKLQHCQKGQYMLVRLPPHCKVKWKGREPFHKDLRRFHSPENSGFIEVSFRSVETAEYHR